MKTFYFTFGWGEKYFPGHHKIQSETREQARAIMFERFGDKWCFCYESLDSLRGFPEEKIEIIWKNGKGVKNENI